MVGSYQKLDINYMKNLIKLNKILGLALTYDSGKNGANTNIYYYHNFIILLGLVVFYVYSALGVYYYVVPTMNTLEILTETSLYSCLLSANIVSLLQSKTKKKTWAKLHMFFKRIDNTIVELPKTKNYQNGIHFQLVFSHFVYFFTASLNVCSWIYKFGFRYYKNYIFEIVIKYYVMIITLTLCNFALAIMRRFQYLNNKLSEAKIYNNLNVNETKKLYDYLILLVKTYNELFGLEILLILTISVLGMLDLLSYVLNYDYDSSLKVLLDLTYFIDTTFLLVI